MGGRLPKPTQLKLLYGTRPDRVNHDEPVPEAGVPECPESVLDADVREVWAYTLRQLVIMKCVTPADRDLLVCWCEAVVSHRKASAILARSPVLVRKSGEDPSLVRNPALIAQRDAALLMSRFAQHFGLSPSARSEIYSGAARGQRVGGDRYLTG